jgi:nucleoid-associated protein YgaU
MNREIKLALVIGMALLLLAGIVISDHLSPASERLKPLQESAEPLRLAATPPATPPLREVGQGSAIADGAATRRTANRTAPPSGGSAAPPVRPIGDEAIVVGPPRDPLAPPARGGEPTTPLPGERTYRVQEGDVLARIAANLYGDASLWEALAAFNRDRLPDPNRLRPGLVLRVPPRERLAAPAAPGASGAESPTVRTAARTRVVREGETLSQIAAETLGSSRRWRDLLEANRDRIADPNRVAVGTELRIPAGG